MSRYEHHDILMELIELCREQKSDILQQLNYYRASVYKSETAQVIEHKISEMQLVAGLIGDTLLQDAFHDYEATRKAAQLLGAPGECLLSTRVTNLFNSCEKIFQNLENELHQKQPSDRKQLSRNVQKLRTQILSMCRQGSRPWAFFSRF